jgi:hypothetical protein
MQSLFPATGGASFMRRIPILELSTPEEYLQLISPPTPEKDDMGGDEESPCVANDENRDAEGSCECCGGGDDDYDDDDDDGPKDGIATETTPLLL